MFFLSFLAIIMRGQRTVREQTVRERSEYSMTVLSTGSIRVTLTKSLSVYQRYIIFRNICTHSNDGRQFKFDETLNLNILSQGLFITYLKNLKIFLWKKDTCPYLIDLIESWVKLLQLFFSVWVSNQI